VWVGSNAVVGFYEMGRFIRYFQGGNVMSCKRCPHHVRHGSADAAGRISFQDLCGLKVKKLEREELEKVMAKKGPIEKKPGASRSPRKYTDLQICEQHPFAASFEYMRCPVYFETFKTNQQKNDVIPTKDFQYSEAFNSVSITDMELL
jgi:hypothetical protein